MAGDHTAGVMTGLVLAAGVALRGGSDATAPAPPSETVDFTAGSVGSSLLLACLAAIPLAISLWALLDAARRPRWAWALAERRQVVWMALIMFGVLTVIVGLPISAWYLLRVRPAVAAVEDGDLSPRRRR